MRTTLAIDEDVAKRLRQEMRRSGMSFKETVNRFLRLGLTASNAQACKRFVVKPRALGLSRGLSYDNVEQLIESLEGAAHK